MAEDKTEVTQPDLNDSLPIHTPESDNFHEVISRKFNINGNERTIELVHQLKSGDCVPVNFVNTFSLEFDGRLPLTVNEARYAAIKKREDEGENAEPISHVDKPLSQMDAVNLFSEIYGKEPNLIEDVLSIEGRLDTIQRQEKAVDILEYLDTYNSGLMTTGLREHSRTIKKLDGDNYAILDPMSPNGIDFKNTENTVSYLSKLMENRPPDSNFFFFIRK